MSTDRLERELRDLSSTLGAVPLDTAALSDRVMESIAAADPPETVAPPTRALARRLWSTPRKFGASPVPGRGHGRRRRATRPALAAAAAGLAIALAVTPPVRAAVADLFGIIVQPAAPAESEPVPGAESDLSLEDASEIISFEPVLPEALGAPEGVDVSPDGRVLSMSWSDADGIVRLDQFEGDLAPAFVKYADAEDLDLDGHPAIWFDGPHPLVALDPDGRLYAESARSAGPTLVWQVDDITLRLEGASRDRAIEIARSVLDTG
jgi:hypothetical protein